MLGKANIDDEGEPIIKYKTETDDYGNEKQVLDYQSMYKFYFQSIDIYEPNITVAIEIKQINIIITK